MNLSFNPLKWFARREQPEQDRRERNAERSAKVMETFQRQFEGAQSDRLNKARWAGAKGTPINVDLRANLTALRDRCEYEIQNNGILSGMIETYIADTVGEEGPMLQIKTTDEAYKAALGKVWWAFWMSPDVTGMASGAELLGEAIIGYWRAGEFLWQMVTDEQATGPVRMRVQTYHTRRLQTPPELTGDRLVTYGVRRTAQGRPTSYWVQDSDESDVSWSVGTKYTELKAEFTIHDFKRMAPGQARGYPLVAPVLDDVADLRDYDKSTMAAAYAATLFAVILYSENAEADPVALQGDYPIERQTMMAAPPGYKAEQLKPEQPGSMYAEFRTEKLSVIGRPVCMPYSKVALNSKQNSYSGTRYDGQGYNRSIKALQGRLGRIVLDRFLAQVVLEATRAGALGKKPADLVTEWGWPAMPEVDPNKEATAWTERIENGTADQAMACSSYGHDVDEVRARRVAQGLPAGPIPKTAPKPPQPSEVP